MYSEKLLTVKINELIQLVFISDCVLQSPPCSGVVTSLVQSGEQWDFPNAWAPCQAMIIYGMERMGKSGSILASELAEKWLKTNFNEWKNGTGHMHEKYNAQSGSAGHGGEYEPQVGFGWTNGVALSLLADYGFTG